MIPYFKLIDRTPVPCTMEEAGDAWRTDRHVGCTKVGCLEVSTVFLPINHAFDNGPPMLFETMIFGAADGDELEYYQRRCSTWEQAEAMHAAAVALVTKRVRKADAMTRAMKFS